MQKNLAILLGVLLAAILLGVGLYVYAPQQVPATAPATASGTPAQNPQTVNFRILDAGAHAASISEKKNYAVYSATEFAKLWKMVHGADGTSAPVIDFSKEYVVGVFAGQKPTGGYSVAVTSIIDAGSSRTVAITLTKPGTGCIVTEALTNPYQLVAVPVGDAILGHTDSEVATPCNATPPETR